MKHRTADLVVAGVCFQYIPNDGFVCVKYVLFKDRINEGCKRLQYLCD